MTLLFTTRKVDKNDDRAGFVSDWLIEFSKHLTKLIVICQEKGDISNLPANVEVYSLGKECGKNKISQFFLLLYYFITLLPKIDGVFSHMVPHYAILAGPWCKIYHKKLIQWYVHKVVSPQLRIADLFVDEYVTTNPESFQLKTKKSIHYFGHGINIDLFKPITSYPPTGDLPKGDKLQITNYQFTILSVSRISPSKNIDLMIQAVEKILIMHPELQNKILFKIIGAPGLEKQKAYYNLLINYVKCRCHPESREYGTKDPVDNLTNNIQFLGPLPPDKLLPYYQNCDLFLNLSDTGSVDKAALEAMACEKLVLTSNVAFKNIIPAKLFLAEKNIDLLADKILEIYNFNTEEKEKMQKKLRQKVVENNNLEKLSKKILNLYL